MSTSGVSTTGGPDVLRANGPDLVRRTKRTVEDLRGAAAEHNKLILLKGSSELISNIHEVLRDIDEQSGKILLTINSSATIYDKLKSLLDTINDISAFFEEVKGTKFMVFAKGKLKRHMVIHYQQLKSKCTDLMSAVSLELLTNKDLLTPEPVSMAAPVPVNAPIDDSALLEQKYLDGCFSFYGIDRPKNFNIAFDLFLYAAEKDHLRSMIMVAEMYSRGYSVESDENICINWLERAATLGCASAKYHLALKMVKKLPIEVTTNPANFEEFSTLSEPEQFRQVLSSLDIKSTLKAFDTTDFEEKEDERENQDSIPTADNRFHVIRRAIQLLLSAAADGHIESNTELGQVFEVVGDFEEASQWYEVAVDAGCLRAKNFLGMLYFTGKGVSCKLETAHDMFHDAARGGNSSAYNNIGLCYERGYGTDINLSTAMNMYLKGSLLGSPHSMYSLGFINIKEALSLANNPTEGAIVSKSRNHRKLSYDKVKTTSEAVALVRHVTTGLGRDFSVMDPSGDPSRYMRSGIRWLRCAAELSVAEAGYQLGLLYEQGTGLPQDATAAYEQFLWAAERGNHRASLHAARMLYDKARTIEEGASVGDQAELERCRDHYNSAAVLYRYAAEYGIPEAMNSLGLMLEDGSAKVDGIPDHAEAAKWYLAAAGAGSIEAAGNLALLLAAKGDGFDFVESNMVSPSGHLITHVELEAWLDNLAQKASGNPRAQWLRDAVARLSGRSLQRQQNKRNVSPNREQREGTRAETQMSRIMISNVTPAFRKNVSEEPLFNASPAFSKRQERHNIPTMNVGDVPRYTPLHRSSDVDNIPVRKPSQDATVQLKQNRPEENKGQLGLREPISTTYAKSLYPKESVSEPVSSISASHPPRGKQQVRNASFESDPHAHISDPSASWNKPKNFNKSSEQDLVSYRDDSDDSDE